MAILHQNLGSNVSPLSDELDNTICYEISWDWNQGIILLELWSACRQNKFCHQHIKNCHRHAVHDNHQKFFIQNSEQSSTSFIILTCFYSQWPSQHLNTFMGRRSVLPAAHIRPLMANNHGLSSKSVYEVDSPSSKSFHLLIPVLVRLQMIVLVLCPYFMDHWGLISTRSSWVCQ